MSYIYIGIFSHTKDTIQIDQLYMVVCFWYLVKSDLSNVRYCTVPYTESNFLQGTRNTQPCLSDHVVYEP